MHDYKTYELIHKNGKKSLYGACCNCGSLEIKTPTAKQSTCPGYMHSNSNVLALKMRIVPVGLLEAKQNDK